LARVFELNPERARGIIEHEPFYDLRRKWALFDAGRMVSILTTVPLEFGWGRAIGLAGVATDLDVQGLGYAGRLIGRVLESARSEGEDVAFLFAENPRAYEKAGFTVIDGVIEGPVVLQPEPPIKELLTYDEVRLIYDRWAMGHPNRLRRSEARWRYWTWALRLCSRWGDGYTCVEDSGFKEWIGESAAGFPIGAGTHIVALESMIRRYSVPLIRGTRTTNLMASGRSEPPELFMSDQF
jgi:GNAT superfamily N-acetyltransferase